MRQIADSRSGRVNRSDQTKVYVIGICCYFNPLTSKNKDWLALINVSGGAKCLSAGG
jgi:hypothetical protein